MPFLAREYKFERSFAMDQPLKVKDCYTSHKQQQQQQQQHKDQHKMAMRSLKKLVKPVLRLIKKKHTLKKTLNEFQQQNANNSSLEDMRKDPVALNATHDNLANEALEQRIIDEIRQCPSNAACIVQEGGSHLVLPVHRQQQYIPVHFARTANGTFFWTSMDMTRHEELQLRAQLDRWGQA